MTFKNDFNFEQMQYSISVLYLKYLIYIFFQSYTIESISDLLSLSGIKSCLEKLKRVQVELPFDGCLAGFFLNFKS